MAATDPVPQPAPSGGVPPSNRDDETTVDLDAQDIPLQDDAGQTFGDYRLLEKIGTSGTSVVFKALQKRLNHVVTLEIQRAGAPIAEDQFERLLRSARVVAAFQHPHIAALYDVGQVEGRCYVTMEYVTGQTLAQISGGKPLPAPRAAKYLEKMAEAVDYAHERGVLHLDLCKGSVIIDESDQPRLFGFESAAGSDPRVTTGVAYIVGNPAYMSPEQVCGKQDLIGRRSDIYALGVILYELVTGCRPFSANSPHELFRQLLEAEPPPPRQLNRRVPRVLGMICLKCLEKEPLRRYATAGELAKDLGRFLYGYPPPGRILPWRLKAVARLCRRIGLTPRFLRSR